MTPNEQFLLKMRDAAQAAGHIFPEIAACEIAVESGWDHSGLIQKTNNAFGQKAPAIVPSGMKVYHCQTNEVIGGHEISVDAPWIIFDSLADCFRGRMALLQREPAYYADALAATRPVDFAMQVSAQWNVGAAIDNSLPALTHPVLSVNGTRYQFVKGRWSTGPTRGPSVVQTYNAHRAIFSAPPAAGVTS